MNDETVIKVVTIITLGVIGVAAVIGLTLVAIFTDRDLLRAEVFTFSGIALIGALGGVSWFAMHRRRRRWHLSLDENGNHKEDANDR